MGPLIRATRDGRSSSASMSLILVKSYLCFDISRGSSGLPAFEFSQLRKIRQFCKECPLQSSVTYKIYQIKDTDQDKFLKLRETYQNPDPMMCTELRA